MKEGATSFEVRTERADRVVQVALERWRRVERPRAGLLFASGKLAERLPELADALATALPPSPDAPCQWLLAAGVGVLTERGELERQSAAAGLVIATARPSGVASGPRLDTFADQVAEALAARPSATALVLVRSDKFEEDSLDALPPPQRRLLGSRAFGGGAAAGADVYLVSPGQVTRGAGAALLLEGLGPPRITAAPAARLLGPLRRVTTMRGSMLLEIGEERALDVLGACTEKLEDQPLILLAVAGEQLLLPASGGGSSASSPQVLLRPIQGVDPSRGGVLVGDAVRPGARVAFAVRDPHVARARLGEQLLALARSSAGSAPRFGIYVNCAGRGSGLYGSPDVDTKLLRARFGDLPLVGLQTAFELAPFDEQPALHLYTGVLGLFCAPS